MADKQSAPRVPARNDLKSSALYRNSRANELQKRDPNYVYQWFSLDPNHPQYVGRYLSEHEVGSSVSGFATIAPWEVVQRTTDPRVAQVEPRTDQGKPIDSTVRHGNQILARLPKEEHEKYAQADCAYQDKLEDSIYSPERTRSPTVSMTAVVSKDEHADPQQMLRQSGHPLPG